jgi:hypothetical protein
VKALRKYIAIRRPMMNIIAPMTVEKAFTPATAAGPPRLSSGPCWAKNGTSRPSTVLTGVRVAVAKTFVCHAIAASVVTIMKTPGMVVYQWNFPLGGQE